MSKPTVLITDGIHESAAIILESSCNVIFKPKLTQDELLNEVVGIDGLMVRSASQVTSDIMAKAPRLKIVGRAGVGTDNIDLNAATRKGIIVVNSPGGNTEAAAEHTMALIFALARHIPQADHVVKTGGWRSKQHTGVELSGKTLGIIGFGKIGRRVASVFQRVGMRICVVDPFLTPQLAEELHVHLVTDDELYAQSDFITLHVPKTPETHHLICEATLGKMKDGVRLINCSRGGVINETDLVAAINSGKVAGAALDVFQNEPPSQDDPLFTVSDRIITTPHLGASTEEAQINVARDVADQIVEYFSEGTAQFAVNIPALRREVLDPVRGYLQMAELMGTFMRQIVPGGFTQVDMQAGGDLAHQQLQPVLLATVKGLLSPTREGVNYVNALIVAEEEGIFVKESRQPRIGSFMNLLTIEVTTNDGAFTIGGTLFAEGLFRIVNLNGYSGNIELSSYMLLTPHVDKPGMIAKVASILGDNKINVSSMNVARKGSAAGGESLMIFNLDDPVPAEVLQQIGTIDGILHPKFIELPV